MPTQQSCSSNQHPDGALHAQGSGTDVTEFSGHVCDLLYVTLGHGNRGNSDWEEVDGTRTAERASFIAVGNYSEPAGYDVGGENDAPSDEWPMLGLIVAGPHLA